MSQPAIKGSAFHAVHADVRRLLEEGRLARARLEAELPAEDLRLLERKVLAGSGYPLESHRRLLELLRDVEGGGRTQCLVRIEVSEAAALPEVTRWTAQGFIQFLARHVRGGLRAVRVTSERPEPDRILFTVHA